MSIDEVTLKLRDELQQQYPNHDIVDGAYCNACEAFATDETAIRDGNGDCLNCGEDVARRCVIIIPPQ